jgi:putative hydrolase of the HAD superfamily
MAIRALVFDLYGTLIDIETDEGMEEIYRGIAHFLTYQGVDLHRWQVRDHYYRLLHEQRDRSAEAHAEIDVLAIWQALLNEQGVKPAATRRRLALILAQIYRGLSRKRLELYPGVKPVLDHLRENWRMALVSDAQPCFALPEMRAMGLSGYFEPLLISAAFGYRKPDPRLFQAALAALKVPPHEAAFVGNDMYHDIFGANRAGLRTIFFASNQGRQVYPDTRPTAIITAFDQLPGCLTSMDERAAGRSRGMKKANNHCQAVGTGVSGLGKNRS